jgi:hypothetical protein
MFASPLVESNFKIVIFSEIRNLGTRLPTAVSQFVGKFKQAHLARQRLYYHQNHSIFSNPLFGLCESTHMPT